MNKDLIKYGLLALGAYLVWKYIEDNGGLSAVLGTTAAAGTTTQTPAQIAAAAAAGTKPPATPPTPPAPKCPTDSQLCWDGSYVYRQGTNCVFPACPPQPAASTGLTPAQLAAQTSQAAQTQYYNQLVAAGVDGTTAQTYINHCGTDGACDSTYLNQLYQQAALGVPTMMKLADVGGILFNADQWEYYREAGGGAPVDPGAVFNDRTTPIHSSTFNAALANFASTGGMSGLGVMVRYTPAWLM